MLSPPILYHYFSRPLPYLRALQLQEAIHTLQLRQRSTSPSSSHQDILLLLQHKPVYTAGRRQTASDTAPERARLTALGADFVLAQRGGQLTYHGPGQLVGYPLLNLDVALSTREYICRLQRILSLHLREAHGLAPAPPSEEIMGVFLGAREKVASIGVQVRHRLTAHGFAMNVTREPLAWFEQIVACGLADVKAVSVEGATGRKVEVEGEAAGIVERFGRVMERQMVPLDLDVGSGELAELVYTLEQESIGDERTNTPSS